MEQRSSGLSPPHWDQQGGGRLSAQTTKLVVTIPGLDREYLDFSAKNSTRIFCQKLRSLREPTLNHIPADPSESLVIVKIYFAAFFSQSLSMVWIHNTVRRNKVMSRPTEKVLRIEEAAHPLPIPFSLGYSRSCPDDSTCIDSIHHAIREIRQWIDLECRRCRQNLVDDNP